LITKQLATVSEALSERIVKHHEWGAVDPRCCAIIVRHGRDPQTSFPLDLLVTKRKHGLKNIAPAQRSACLF